MKYKESITHKIISPVDFQDYAKPLSAPLFFAQSQTTSKTTVNPHEYHKSACQKMRHPYQCLVTARTGATEEADVLLAACGPEIHVHGVESGELLAVWPEIVKVINSRHTVLMMLCSVERFRGE